MTSNRQLIITGMHRSGTSFMANWLRNSGLFIGDRLAGATPSNVNGHFEDIDFLELHERILKDNDTTMYLHEDKSIQIEANRIDEAHAIINDRNERFQQWGFKQPRAALMLHLWEQVLPEAFYIVPLRHPAAIVNSIVRREANKCILRHDEIEGPRLRALYLEQVLEHAARYDAMNAIHLERVLKFKNSLPNRQMVVVNFDEIQLAKERLEAWLNEQGFEIKLESIDDLFSDNLLIKKQEHHIAHDMISEKSMTAYHALLGMAI